MAKRAGDDAVDGREIGANLVRLGYFKLDAARVVREMEGRGESLSRHRLGIIVKSPTVLPGTAEKIARGLGIPVEELTRPSPRPKSPPPARGKGKGKGKG